PPRGGNPSLSDLEVARAVAHMANASGGSFDEPADDGAAKAEAPQADAAPAADSAPEADAASEDTAETTDTTDAAQAAASDTAAPGLADVQPILTKNACLACHAVDNRMVGPSYREVAEKY